MRKLALILVWVLGACGDDETDAQAQALPRSDCYQTDSDGIISFEAEQLPINESWAFAAGESGFSGSGFIQWTGNSQNNNPGRGLMSVTLSVDSAGLYRFRWRTGVGRGDDGTEHNDTWLRFPDATAYYGRRVRRGNETRRYPKPLCEDQAAMSDVEQRDGISDAGCPEGSTRDGWLKAYRSGDVRESDGSLRWTWDANTSDNEAHPIHALFEQAGDYTLEISARGDFHLLDRVVVHPFDLTDTEAEAALALERGNTLCDE